MKSNFPKVSFFLSIIFLAISLAVFLYFLREINNNISQSQLAETELYAETLRRSEIEILNNSVKKVEIERLELETHFARSSDVVPFLNAIEGLAFKVGAQAQVSSVDILKDSVGLMVGLKASGSFASLYKFITLLENSSYELEISSMNMNGEVGADTSAPNTGGSKWNAVFKIKLLSFTN